MSLWKPLAALLLAAALIAGGVAWHEQRQEQRTRRTIRESQEAVARARELQRKLDAMDERLKAQHERLMRLKERKLAVTVTAYDLGYESCGKLPGHPLYGVTASGRSLAGHSRESAMAIAVDPDVIPLGTPVRLEFDDDSMKRYNGVYTAVDTGGAIRGNRIDLFVGESNRREAMRIGRRSATATVIEEA